MNAVQSAVVAKVATGNKGPMAFGVHPVDLTLTVTDNVSGVVDTTHYVGSVQKCEDQMIAATATIPWLTVCARLALSLGITHDAVLAKLRDAILSAVDDADSVDAAIKAMDKRVAGSVDLIKAEIAAKLPLIPRSGATKVAIKEVSVVASVEVEVLTNA